MDMSHKFNKAKIFKVTAFIVPLAVFVIISFYLGFWEGTKFGYQGHWPKPLEKILNAGKPADIPEGDMSVFWNTWGTILEKYVGRGKLDTQKMIEGATEGLVNSLEDPYSEFMNATTTRDFNQELSGSFEGVGMELSKQNGVITVVAPLKGSPAEKAGIRAGDKILKVDDKNIQSFNLLEAVKLIRGPKGTSVTLTILRPGETTTKEFKLIRDAINVISCEWEMLNNQIALLKIYNFSQPVLSEFYKSATEMIFSKPKAIIIDMRNNPGGYLEAATEIAGWFLDRGDVIVKEDFGNGQEPNVYRASGNNVFSKTPLIVLVNEGTASASEILAGALKDVRGIKLVGIKTFGKGSVQELVPLADGSSLKVSIARWLTPNGNQIDQKGLEPDYTVKLPDDYQSGTYAKIDLEKDLQLKKAYEIISQ